MLRTETVSTVKAVRLCDLCDREDRNLRRAIAVCFGCRQDVCAQCSQILDPDPFTGDYDDYPSRICAGCNALLQPYAVQASALREEFEQRLSAIEQSWLKTIKEKNHA